MLFKLFKVVQFSPDKQLGWKESLHKQSEIQNFAKFWRMSEIQTKYSNSEYATELNIFRSYARMTRIDTV